MDISSPYQGDGARVIEVLPATADRFDDLHPIMAPKNRTLRPAGASATAFRTRTSESSSARKDRRGCVASPKRAPLPELSRTSTASPQAGARRAPDPATTGCSTRARSPASMTHRSGASSALSSARPSGARAWRASFWPARSGTPATAVPPHSRHTLSTRRAAESVRRSPTWVPPTSSNRWASSAS